MAYFDQFPLVAYSTDFIDDGSVKAVTNIMARIRFREVVKNNTLVYYTYDIQDSDTPEIIAHKYYGSPNRHWIVLLANDILNPFYDWPLPYEVFTQFIIAKYGSILQASTTIDHYNQVITKTDSATGVVTIRKYEIDQATYNLLPATDTQTINLSNGTSILMVTTTEAINAYDTEFDLNETKRTIKLIDASYIPQIENEFKRLMK